MAVSTHKIVRRGIGPIIAAAIHDGSDLRSDIQTNIALTDIERVREEDPYTGAIAQVAQTQILGLRSRFEVDLNRPRNKAVYRTPDDAWGLNVWYTELQESMIEESLAIHDRFYKDVENLIREMLKQKPKLVIYDIHTYNHRRAGEFMPVANIAENPEVNIGTGTMDRSYWGPVVDEFISVFRNEGSSGRLWDVRENVKFQGGHFSKWIHSTFPHQVCSISIEFKKVFMNEWSGEADLRKIEEIFEHLASTILPVEKVMEQL